MTIILYVLVLKSYIQPKNIGVLVAIRRYVWYWYDSDNVTTACIQYLPSYKP